MFVRKSETDHLLDITTAKRIFKKLLEPRIKIYEDRLKKPWYERGIEYLSSEYGEAGYERTKKFLNEMQNIHRTENLIQLTTEQVYQKGTKLLSLLQQAVVEISGFKQEHINLIIRDLRAEITEDHNRYVVLRLFNLDLQAIRRIYENILESKENYGNDYLHQLNDRLNSNSYNVELRKIN